MVSLPFGVLILPRALLDGEIFPLLLLSVAPLLVAAPVVAGATIIIGLPVTAALSRQGRESARVYGCAGAVAGAIVTAALIFLMNVLDGYWLVPFGSLSGAVTAYTWWKLERAP